MNAHTSAASITSSRLARRAGSCTGRFPLAHPKHTMVPSFLSNPTFTPAGHLGFSSRIRKPLS